MPYATAYAAMVNVCNHFMLISTDNAVNPINIMGVSNHLCEIIIQPFDRNIRDGKTCEIMPLPVHSEDTDGTMIDMVHGSNKSMTEFIAVLFGNVLGSNGSIVPRFK